MFGGCFALNDLYRKRRGSSIRASIEASFVGSLAGIVCLLILGGFKLEFTPFTLLVALLAASNRIAFTFFSFKALSSINLSLYSLFSMLGGMMLPFVQGIVFYGEKITLAKVVCVIIICVALALTVKRGDKSRGYVYYIGVFVLNGMSGVLSKIFSESSLPKASAAGYSLWISIGTVAISGVVWLALARKKQSNVAKYNLGDCAVGAVNGGMSAVANCLLVIALASVDASVQYPAVTGGVMIVSTLICFFGERKPSKKELVSIALAFCGTLALFVIPI
jgi:drug/metabolite transporter (DMT)-like permease